MPVAPRSREWFHPRSHPKEYLDAIRKAAGDRGLSLTSYGDQVFLTRRTRGGFAIDCRQIRVNLDDVMGSLGLVDAEVCSMLDPAGKKRVASSSAARLVDVKFAGAYPTLYDYLTQATWADGTQRQTASVLMFVKDGQAKGMLRDPNDSTCCWVAARTLTDLFAALEAAVRNPETDWRDDRRLEGQQAHRRKKAG